MLWTILVLVLLCGFGKADNSSNETEDCMECIGQYSDLEIFIMNNKTLVEKLSQAFFTTGSAVFGAGRGSSRFIKISYNYKLQTRKCNHSVEENVTHCSSQQSTYIWSETATYLLGPSTLRWLTLFAIYIDEADVTIELPCLCNDDYNSLLSRLTYLV